MKRQDQDYERRIMQLGCVQAHWSVLTKGDSGEQDQERRLYKTRVFLPRYMAISSSRFPALNTVSQPDENNQNELLTL